MSTSRKILERLKQAVGGTQSSSSGQQAWTPSPEVNGTRLVRAEAKELLHQDFVVLGQSFRRRYYAISIVACACFFSVIF